MKKVITPYILLLIAAAAEIRFAGRASWFPDLILLAVIFTAVFRGPLDGCSVGLAAGILGGFFSPYTFGLDIVIFPAVGFFSGVAARMFYKRNALAHMLITAASIAFVITSHALYLNVISGNVLSPAVVFLDSWRIVATTVVISPVLFFIFMEIVSVASADRNNK